MDELYQLARLERRSEQPIEVMVRAATNVIWELRDMWDEDDLRELIRRVASTRDTFPGFLSNHAERASDPEVSQWSFDAMPRGIRLAPRPLRNRFHKSKKMDPATEARQLALRKWINFFFNVVVRSHRGYHQSGDQIPSETIASLLAQPTNAVLWAREFVAFVQRNGTGMRTPEEEKQLLSEAPDFAGALPSLYSVAEHRHKGRLGEKSLWTSLRQVAREQFQSRQFCEEIARLSSSG